MTVSQRQFLSTHEKAPYYSRIYQYQNTVLLYLPQNIYGLLLLTFISIFKLCVCACILVCVYVVCTCVYVTDTLMKVTNSRYFNNYRIMPSLTWISSMPWFLPHCHLADYAFLVLHIQFSWVINICEMFPLTNTMSFHSCLILHVFFFLHSLYGSTGHQVRQETTKPTQKWWSVTVYTRKRHAINSGCLCWLLGVA